MAGGKKAHVSIISDIYPGALGTLFQDFHTPTGNIVYENIMVVTQILCKRIPDYWYKTSPIVTGTLKHRIRYGHSIFNPWFIVKSK